MIKKADSIIFDMDGTLWDAVDTYVTCWNRSFEKNHIARHLKREDLEYMMGWEKSKILDRIMPGIPKEQQEQVFATVNEIREAVLPELGGRMYDGVREGLEALSGKYPLFIVSNCPAGLIQLFKEWAKIEHFITDEMAHGANSQSKHFNIRLLIEKHALQLPIYVGDTETDSKESRLAGIPFVFLEGGFGNTDDYDMRFKSFPAFTEYFLNLSSPD